MLHCTHCIWTFSSLEYNCFTYKKNNFRIWLCYKSHYYAAYECTNIHVWLPLFLISTPLGTFFCCKYSWLFFFLYVLHCKQATGNSVVTVGYVMKPSLEEDFAKVNIIWINVFIFSGEKRQEVKLCEFVSPSYDTIYIHEVNTKLQMSLIKVLIIIRNMMD